MDQTELHNQILLRQLSDYLNGDATAITADDIAAVLPYCDGIEEAYALLLAAVLGLDVANEPEHHLLYQRYFPLMVHMLDPARVKADPYYRDIRFPDCREGSVEFRMQHYLPYETFVCDDLEQLPDGRIIPHIGFFTCDFAYPAVLEDGRLWMMVTPSEIATMSRDIQDAHGTVLAYGLGLGYFAYMAALKPQVDRVIVVDCSPQIIDIFQRHILPQFPDPSKVEIVCEDAYIFAEHDMAATNADYVYVDLWHDAGDGLEMYAQMKDYEHLLPNAEFRYWIEPTLKCYL